MATTAEDVLSGDDIDKTIREVRPNTYVFRRAYQNHDATNANSDKLSFDRLDFDLDGELMEVPENASRPRVSFNQNETTAFYTEYGLEVPITDKAIKDGKFDQRVRAIEQLAEAEEDRMDAVAANVIENNRDSETVGDTSGSIEYSDITDAVAKLLGKGFNRRQMEVYVPGSAYSTFMNMSDFEPSDALIERILTEGTLEGSDMEQNLLGVVGGAPVYLSTADNSPLSAGQAYVVDTATYGWESVREEFNTSSYREKEKRTVYATDGRYDWVSTEDEAAIKIDS